MHKRTQQILKNLGYEDKILNQKKKFNRKTLGFLKSLGVPPLAIQQIKFLESPPTQNLAGKPNKELIELLIKKCKRSLDAFANKGCTAKIIFENKDWTLFSNEYNKTIEKLLIVCKPYFDEWSDAGVEVIFQFDDSNTWKIMTNKESDLPGI